MTTSLILSLLPLAFWLTAAITLQLGMRRIEHLDGVPPAEDGCCPSLSVIVPACNEAQTIEPALVSLLALDYPRLELIVVEDRSTDETGAILDRLAGADPRLRVIHVTELPAGWLGKNHALQVGSQAATGEWLLFTDADVLFRPAALRRVMAWAARRAAEHAVVFPQMIAHGFWERLLVTYFCAMFNLRFRPWLVANQSSPAYLGIGAFNLVRAERYHAFGGHSAFPLDVLDDMKLGKLMKSHGARSGVLMGGSWVRVRWVIGLRGFIDGLAKNCFAGFAFSLPMVGHSLLAILLTQVLPPLGLLAGGRTALVAAATFAAMAWTAACAGLETGDRLISPSHPLAPSFLWGLAFPLAALVFIYVALRSTWLAYRRGSVLWRGTLYPLEELRRGMV